MVPEIEIQEIAKYAESVNIYDGGVVAVYPKGERKFEEVCAVWTGMLKSARQMPAFGVSLHGETSDALKSNLWAEFVFDRQYCNNGMPFERLLVNVVPEFTGFNVIRYNSDRGYDGRCFYFDLNDSDMADLYNTIRK